MDLILKTKGKFFKRGRVSTRQRGMFDEPRFAAPPSCRPQNFRRHDIRDFIALAFAPHATAAKCFLKWARAFQLILAMTLLARSAFAEPQVRTLGGGRASATGQDAGYVDGNTLQASQFNFPAGAAVDFAGNVYVADRNNGALRKLDLSANRVSTILSGLNQPVAVAIDSTNNLYVLTQSDGLIRRLDRFGIISTNKARLNNPTALALDATNNFYVAEAGGNVVRIDATTESQSILRAGFKRPSGIAVLDSGLVVVSDTDNHRVLSIDPNTGATILEIGTGAAGFRDGSISNAQFNQPHQLARAPDGSVLVADRMNHRVRLIRADGVVTTLYGIDPKLWEGPECLTCNPIILPGWFDSSSEFAEAREPVGVAVAKDGKVYSTEVYYHLVREITGTGLTSEAGTGGATNLVVLAPAITPDSGYFPLGQDITVVNPNTNSFFNNSIFYTLDGTDPTTNSLRLNLSNSVGTIRWRETTRDLTSLKVVALVGNRSSEITKGKPAASNEIGITRNLTAGAGSTIVVPVTVNLRPELQLRSLQFRVEVSPKTISVPPIPERFRALPISTNDFIPVVTSSEPGGVSVFGATPYADGAARGLAITFIGTAANFSVKNFAVVSMIAVPIPPSAKPGDTYQITVVRPSSTSDGNEAAVALATMPPREIAVTETGYWVGDSSPANWYNADSATKVSDAAQGSHRVFGTFGFGGSSFLDNADVNNAFAAALGVRVPYSFSDLFDAMDVYPEDSPGSVGGDGLIRFLDWQVILRRSLGLDSNLWIRYWSSNGARSVEAPNRAFLPNTPANLLAASGRTSIWLRQAVISATSQENVQPGNQTDLPVYLTVRSDYQVAGMAFRATLNADGEAPALQQPVQFIPASNVPHPIQSTGLAANDLLCGWPLVANYNFDPPLRNKTLLGHVRFTLPISARAGQSYTLRFSNADGSPDLHTQYDFESLPATVWVQTAALRKPEVISDEWKVFYFGSLNAEAASPDADPDHDGVSNLSEYLAGTNPINPESSLRLAAPRFDASKNQVVLRWFGAPGRFYAIEVSASVDQPVWKPVASGLAGSGAFQEFTQINATPGAQFFRLRLDAENAAP